MDEKNRKVIEDFLYLGMFKLDGEVLEFKKYSNSNNTDGSYAIVCNEEIYYLGHNQNVENVFQNIYTKGGSKTNYTFRRITPHIKEELKNGNKVDVYYKNSNEGDNYCEKYKKLFNILPKWNEISTGAKKKAIKGNNRVINRVIKKFLHENKQKIKDLIGKDDEEEFLADKCLHNGYNRNFLVRKMALEKAGNRCALDGYENKKCNYFERENKILNIEKEYYLEVHHLVPIWSTTVLNKVLHKNFTVQDIDILENTVCLCSCCHRKMHYGEYAERFKILRYLYDKNSKNLCKSGINISFEELKELYKGW